jgi:hypothetical protein
LKLSLKKREDAICIFEQSIMLNGKPRPDAQIQCENPHNNQEDVNVNVIFEYTANSHLATETIIQMLSVLKCEELHLQIGLYQTDICHVISAK